jgi:hypothetical protein
MKPILKIQGKLVWEYCQSPKSGKYVAVCDALKLTVQSDTYPELMESISETLDSVFRDLLANGNLKSFLRKHGWRLAGEPPKQPSKARFDVEWNTRPVTAHDFGALVC